MSALNRQSAGLSDGWDMRGHRRSCLQGLGSRPTLDPGWRSLPRPRPIPSPDPRDNHGRTDCTVQSSVLAGVLLGVLVVLTLWPHAPVSRTA